jgi:hypothetical protein
MSRPLLIEGDPIASAALEEFNRPDLVGSFIGCPADGDIGKLQAAATGEYYVAASTALFNASPDLRKEPRLGVGVYVFEPEPDEEVRKAFIATYGIVDLFKQAYQEVSEEMEPEEAKGVRDARQVVLDETVRALSSQEQRLIGGYAVLASVAEPKSYSGFVYFARELVQQYQFAAREAALRGALTDMPENLRRNKLVMHVDSQIEGAALGTIIRKLLPLEKLEAALSGATPE